MFLEYSFHGSILRAENPITKELSWTARVQVTGHPVPETEDELVKVTEGKTPKVERSHTFVHSDKTEVRQAVTRWLDANFPTHEPSVAPLFEHAYKTCCCGHDVSSHPVKVCVNPGCTCTSFNEDTPF